MLHFITKQEVRDLAQKHNCQTRYEGETRTMYIIGVNATQVIHSIEQMPEVSCPFKLKAELKRQAVNH